MSTKPKQRVVQRLCYSVHEAADSLGMSETYFRSNVLPHLPVVDAGTRVLVDVEDLRRWVDEHKVTSSASRERQGVAGRSGSGSTGRGKSLPPESETALRLTERLERSMRRRSQAKAQVLPFTGASSRRGSSEHG
jgi:hypothetical protein